MSWTNEHVETNYFKTKNNKEVREVFESMGFCVYEENDKMCAYAPRGEGLWFDDNTEVILAKKPITIDGKQTNFVGCVNDSIMEGLEEHLENNNLEEQDVVIQPITDYLQDMLLEGQGIAITTAGFEERCSEAFDPFGDVILITKNSVNFMSLRGWLSEKAKELKVEI